MGTVCRPLVLQSIPDSSECQQAITIALQRAYPDERDGYGNTLAMLNLLFGIRTALFSMPKGLVHIGVVLFKKRNQLVILYIIKTFMVF